MMSDDFVMVATTLYGLENVLAGELKELGARDLKLRNRAVEFRGDKGFLYKANLMLRTALRVLVPISGFDIRGERDYYRSIKAIPWDQYFFTGQTFSIKTVAHTRVLTSNSHYLALKAKDAIVDFFRERYGKRPSIDTKNPDIRIQVYIQDKHCRVLLDSSGEALFKRGYRRQANQAPLNEVLGAGMLKIAGYDGSTDLLDPMCGSGTLLIEAAMIAARIPPGLARGFGFEHWQNFDEDLFHKIKDSQMAKIRDPQHEITGYDIDAGTLRKAKMNIAAAHLEDFIRLEKKDFFTTGYKGDEPLLLVFNPPYGERLPVDAPVFYKKTGDTLKRNYQGTKAWIITPEQKGVKHTGLHAGKKVKLYNGSLECRFIQYELYEGSRKKKKNNE